MTLETSVRKQTFAGGQGTLTYSFKVLPDHPEDVHVTVTETATSVDADLTYSTDYTVTQETDGVGGTVVVSPSYSTSYTYTVYRETTDKQESDYDDYNQFPAETLEEDLDRLHCLTQELAEGVARSIQVPITTVGATPDYAELLGDAEAAAAASAVSAATYATNALNSSVSAATSATTAVSCSVICQSIVTDAVTTITDSLNTSIYGRKTIILKAISETTTVLTGNGKINFTIPGDIDGFNLVNADAAVYTVATATSTTIMIHNATDAQDMLSGVISISPTYYSSFVTTAGTINTSYDDVAKGDRIRIDVDSAGTGAKGLDVILVFQKP